jgi:hypothetical protein
MIRALKIVFMTLVLVSFVCFAKPARAIMPEAEAENIVAAAYQAVQDCLDALETANASEDLQQIDQALKALNLSVSNYAIASEDFAKLQAGTLRDDSTLTTCYLIADKLSIFSSQLISKNLKSAWFFLTEAQGLAAFLPSPANPGEMSEGLAGLQSRILTASSEAISILSSAGVYGGEGKDEGGGGKLGINTQVGSPI